MKRIQMLLAAAVAATVPAVGVSAQEPDLTAGLKVVKLQVQPAEITVQAGQQATFKLVALDAQGKVVNAPLRVGGARGGVQVGAGTITGLKAGSYEVIASVILPPDADRQPAMVRIPVTVTWPAVTQVSVSAEPGQLAVGTTLAHSVTAKHADGSERPSPTARWASSDPGVATVDRFGNVTGVKQGAVTITATVERANAEARYTVVAFPATKLAITVSSERARTGDVITLGSRATNASGAAVNDLPVTWSFTFVPDDSIRAPGAGGLLRDGKFVAEVAGVYTILASSGPITTRRSIDVRPRDVIRQVEVRGHGSVSNVHTSDLWVYQGLDGRDYAVTGTWGGDGYAYFWDVTDPSSIAKTDSLKVDARTVNDVKVSPDGRYGALSREGASNRRNGVVILDLANPAHPVIASVYDDGLTGGVHNMFATKDYLFALSGGDKYVILDVRDLKNPKYVSEYDHPDSRVHDVWVNDGIAYSSEWGTGVVIVDVGNGKWGGSIEKPKFVTAVPYPVGANHASFPYFQKSTGRFYLFLGDEIMPRGPGVAWNGAGLPAIPEKGGPPAATSGYYHIIDFTDPGDPKDVARYEVKEFGTHNLWVEDDVLYSAYYEGGLRVVDVSGELMGNLANQGREMAVFKAFDPDGYVANAPMTWGPQPFKGHVFFSDFNSGLWSVRLLPKKRDVS